MFYRCFVIISQIDNIAFSVMFHCMNLVDCIFWICVLVLFLVMCVFTVPCQLSMFGKALLFRNEKGSGCRPADSDVVRIKC